MSASAERGAHCELSVVIKALNEERNIERTLRSALAATHTLDAEVILADSLSTDATVDIARGFPVLVVQLRHGKERCCGIGAQLGYQHARGEFILVIDGDMEVERDWLLAALERLKAEPRLAGVGGIVDDVNLDNIEFRARQQRRSPDAQSGPVDHLNGGGLYRRSAIEQVRYLTHRSLHAYEELELGLRLRVSGWRLERLNLTSIHHYGHTVPMWSLIKRRWRSRYVNGAGELLRASLGQPWFWATVWSLRLRLAVIGWWGTVLVLLAAGVVSAQWALLALAVMLVPPVIMVARKRSVSLGMYSILAWCVDAVGLVRGVCSRPTDPAARIDSRVLEAEASTLV